MNTITDYKCVTDVEGILAYMGDVDKVAFDYETAPDEGYRDDDKAALDPAKSHICMISLSVEGGSGIMVPVAHKTGKNIDPIEFGAWLKEFLTDPTADCPLFKKFLAESMGGNMEQVKLIQEIMGYFLIPVNSAQKCFLIVGAAGAGKSVLLRVLNELLLGKENVSNVSWQALNERFKPAELFGKLANIFVDPPTKNIDDNGIFKALVGQDFLTMEKKNKNPFSFQSTARLLFSCNSIPKNYGDRSEGFYRRLITRMGNLATPLFRYKEFVVDWGGSYGNEYRYVFLLTPYLATICNLSQAVVKNADKTMKITYTLTEQEPTPNA